MYTVFPLSFPLIMALSHYESAIGTLTFIHGYTAAELATRLFFLTLEWVFGALILPASKSTRLAVCRVMYI